MVVIFLNYVPSIRGGQCDYWARAPKDLAQSLTFITVKAIERRSAK
jgi:hypothetical protein